jgi:hypothetical protein
VLLLAEREPVQINESRQYADHFSSLTTLMLLQGEAIADAEHDIHS